MDPVPTDPAPPTLEHGFGTDPPAAWHGQLATAEGGQGEDRTPLTWATPERRLACRQPGLALISGVRPQLGCATYMELVHEPGRERKTKIQAKYRVS
jgi:hypothetical protein